jgi:hypothetical protein
MLREQLRFSTKPENNMKFMLALLLGFCGCSAEVVVSEKNDTVPDSRSFSYPNEGLGAPGCLPPLTLTTIENGKPVEKTYYFPCDTTRTFTSPASDPPGWGSDGFQSNDYGNFVPGQTPTDPAIDPIPFRK